MDIFDLDQIVEAQEEIIEAPEPEEIEEVIEEAEEVTVSDNVIEILKSIDEKLERGVVSEDSIQYVSVSGGNVPVDVPDSVSVNALTVSDNLLLKPLNEYSTEEGLLLFNFITIFFVLMLLAIRKAVFKWK